MKLSRHVHPQNHAAEVNNTEVSDLQVRQNEGRGKRGTGNTLLMSIQGVLKPMCQTHSANRHGTVIIDKNYFTNVSKM